MVHLRGPNVFPILFAAVVGRALKGILCWRLERGERLGILDLLVGSTTLVNTITTQITLRIFSLIGPLLFVVWALSPVGGQASLRVMTKGNNTLSTRASFDYMLQTSRLNLSKPQMTLVKLGWLTAYS